MGDQSTASPWHEIVLDTLKRNEVRLVTYVPDKVLAPLIEAVATPTSPRSRTTREEEALGMATGAWMGGMRGVVLMQTAGSPPCPTPSPRWRCPIGSRW